MLPSSSRGSAGPRDSGSGSPSPPLVREARLADLEAVDRIYDHYVLHSTCTAQLEPAGLDARITWFAEHDARHPIVVAEDDGAVVGWASLSAYHRRAAYGDTVENSVYVDHRAQGRGIGTALLGHLVGRAQKLGHHTIVAAVVGSETASLRLHAKHGFVEAGRLREVMRKFDMWLDVVFLQKHLHDETSRAPHANTRRRVRRLSP
jgi:L-amino acid N-acyltransferase YncA